MSLAITIIGTLAGLLGLYLFLKRGYQGRLTYVEGSCIGLFDSIIRNLPEIDIRYAGSPEAPVVENGGPPTDAPMD
jgi:hypothetical protein